MRKGGRRGRPFSLGRGRQQRSPRAAHHAAISPFIGATPSVSGNTERARASRRQPEMIGEHALQHRAHVGRRLEVAPLIEVGGLQAGQSAITRPPAERAADEKGDGGRAVVGADRAVDMRGAAKFGDRDDHRVVPARPEFALEGGEGAVEAAEQLRQPPARAALVGVGVPAVEGERADARTVVGGHQPRRAFGRLAHQRRRRRRPASAPSMPWRSAMPVGVDARLQRLGERRVGLGVKVHQPRDEIVGRRSEARGRPAEDRRRAAHTSGATAPTASARGPRGPFARRQRRDGAIEPAALDLARASACRSPAHPARRNASVRDNWSRVAWTIKRLLGVIEAGEIGHRRIEAEETVERQRRMRAVPAQRQRAMQIGIIGIADRRDRGEPVERAAQDDDDEPRIARVAAALAQRGMLAAGEGRAGGAEQRAAGKMGAAKIATSLSPLEFRRQDQQRIGLLPRLGARHRLARRAPKRSAPSTSSSSAGGRGASFTWRANCAASSTPRLHAFGRGPGRALSSENHWARRAATAASRGD